MSSKKQAAKRSAKSLAIIGGGNMGLAFARSVLEQGVLDAADLAVVESRAGQRQKLRKALPKALVAAPGELNLATFATIVLSFKPQELTEASRTIALGSSQLVISMLTGVTFARLRTALGQHHSLVRIVPSLAMLVGEGAVVYMCAAGTNQQQKRRVARLISSCGLALPVESEDLLDAATSISATGPGFIFYIIGAFLSAAQEFGFSKGQAQKLVANTFVGAAKLFAQTNRSAEKLCAMVTSKGGTTAAGLKKFQDGRLRETVIAGLRAALKRCREFKASA